MPLNIVLVGSRVLPTMQRVPLKVHGHPIISLQSLKDLVARARARTMVPRAPLQSALGISRDGEDEVLKILVLKFVA